jgi:hypothetical protein
LWRVLLWTLGMPCLVFSQVLHRTPWLHALFFHFFEFFEFPKPPFQI